jgi:hypothetical protein
MPRPCTVENHARGYREASEGIKNGHGLAPWSLREVCGFLISREREPPRRKAVASQSLPTLLCSRERDSPRRKAVASV